MNLLQYNIVTLHPRDEAAADRPLEPGDVVFHSYDKNSYGTIVAIAEGLATVLWSREPNLTFPSIMSNGYVFAPYVPLVVTPTIFNSERPEKLSGFKRYDKSIIRSDYYGTISVDKLPSGST